MPYIKNQATKESISQHMEEVVTTINNPGDLNFAITSLIHHYWRDSETPNYVIINDIMRVVVPYEEQKMSENGDVYLV
jgi:hypothetical protein